MTTATLTTANTIGSHSSIKSAIKEIIMNLITAFLKGFILSFIASFIFMLALVYIPAIGFMYLDIISMSLTVFAIAGFVIYNL